MLNSAYGVNAVVADIIKKTICLLHKLLLKSLTNTLRHGYSYNFSMH